MMPYNLAQMVKQQRRRRARVRIKVRNAPQRLERDLLSIIRGVISDPNSEVAFSTAVLRAMEWLNSAARWSLGHWEKDVLRQLNIDLRGLATVMDSDPEVQAAFEWLIALIRDVQVQTSTRITTQQAANVSLGVTHNEARSAIQDVIRGQIKRAELIAHDQTQKIAAKINQAQQQEAGISKYIWNHSFLPNPRRHHVERQGNIYEWSKPPRDGHPGTAINCRCTAEPVIDI